MDKNEVIKALLKAAKSDKVKELTDEEIEKVTGGVSDVLLEIYREKYGQPDGSFRIPCGMCGKVFQGTDLDQLLDEAAEHLSAEHPIYPNIDNNIPTPPRPEPMDPPVRS